VTQALRQPGIVVQALHLLGRAGEGVHAAHGGERRARSSCPAGRAARTGSPQLRRTSSTGPMRHARQALAKSKNLVTIRVLPGHRAAVRAGLHHRASASTRSCTPLT
jgi:membrane carboxypeptidase/penicillin-binding protein